MARKTVFWTVRRVRRRITQSTHCPIHQTINRLISGGISEINVDVLQSAPAGWGIAIVDLFLMSGLYAWGASMQVWNSVSLCLVFSRPKVRGLW